MNAQTPMSGQPGTGQSPTNSLQPAQPGKGSRALRVLALTAVCAGVVALAAATFVLSYPGLHAVALQAGVTPRLARGYPLIIDAMLVIVLAVVLALRGAGLPSKLLTWITLLAVLAAAAGADALHAAGHRLPVKSARITAAVLPWVLVFLAFTLLLVLLRHFRLRRQAAVRDRVIPRGEARAHWQPDGQQLAAADIPALDLPARPSASTAGIVPGFPAGPPALAVIPAAAPADSDAVPPGAAYTVPAGPIPAEAVPPADTVPADTLSADTVPADTLSADTARAGSGLADILPADAGPADVDPADTGPAGTPADDSAASEPDEAPSPYATVQPVLSVPRQPGPASAADDDPEFAGRQPELAEDAELPPDDPSSDEAAGGPQRQGLPDLDVTGDSSFAETGYSAPDFARTDDSVPGYGPADPDFSPASHGGTSVGTPEEPAPSATAEPRTDAAGSGAAGSAAADSDGVAAGSAAAGSLPGAHVPPAGTTAGGEPEDGVPDSDDATPDDPDMPVFHRMWSSPTPPAGM